MSTVEVRLSEYDGVDSRRDMQTAPGDVDGGEWTGASGEAPQ